MKTVVILTFFIIAVYILWNCDVPRSTSVLIMALGIIIYMLAHPGREEFEEQALSADILGQAGLTKPSLFDCATGLGSSPMNPLAANLESIM
jgi:hypothetical protein